MMCLIVNCFTAKVSVSNFKVDQSENCSLPLTERKLG